jgi:hypothetical protein
MTVVWFQSVTNQSKRLQASRYTLFQTPQERSDWLDETSPGEAEARPGLTVDSSNPNRDTSPW